MINCSSSIRYAIFLGSLVFLSGLLLSCRSISQSGIGLPQSQVILSFDDGPNCVDDSTIKLLDVLEKYQIHSMFVILGVNAEQNPDLVRRIYEDGHCIINHGYSDKWNCWMRKNEFRENLLKGEAAIAAALGTGYTEKLYRPHGGFYRRSQEKIWIHEGYSFVPGSIRIFDAVRSGENQDWVLKKVITKTEKNKGGIILLHDTINSYSLTQSKIEKKPNGPFNRLWIPGTVEKIITTLLEEGYYFDNSISQLAEVRD